MWNEAHQKKKKGKKRALEKSALFFLKKKKGTLKKKKKRAAEGDKKKTALFFFEKKGHEKVKVFASKFWVEYICFGAKSALGKYTFGWNGTDGNRDSPNSRLRWTNCQIDKMMRCKKRRD